MGQWKATDWWELDWKLATVRDKDVQTLDGVQCISVKISHPDLPTKRAIWFTMSKAGNLYWRKTNKSYENATAYIIKNGVALLT